ncbi:MAG: bifunctional ornithine acetyltransferase/N-acetylglutamate synthase [Planctomycetes bacterium]|nr:bifunctional ornithine acetyltransferase/N-acetylglutamate synthase [Planctomycetota bacterium]
MSAAPLTQAATQAPPFPRGFTSASVSAGIKAHGGPDLALLRCDGGAVAAAMFTTNAFAAAPILASRRNLRDSHGHCSALVVNSGCANAATGPEGAADAEAMIDAVAAACDCTPAAVLVNSTGVIGRRLPIDRMVAAIPALAKACVAGSCEPFERGIMTTDTRPKMSTRTLAAQDGGTIRVTGVAKGAGMIHPNMATTIIVVTTDAAVEPPALDAMLRTAVEGSFHRISIDGDTSTNDSIFCLASGAAGPASDAAELQHALSEVAGDLARMVVQDGCGFAAPPPMRTRCASPARWPPARWCGAPSRAAIRTGDASWRPRVAAARGSIRVA